MFDQLLELVEKQLQEQGKSFDINDVIQEASKTYLQSSKEDESRQLTRHRKNHQEFINRNTRRWESGLDQLELLYITSQEAGVYFQDHYLGISELEHDPLLGVLMRLHGNGLRITSEIIHLLKGGYADGALARWRSLFEIAVTSLVIHRYGRDAAVDYIKHGYIKTVEGREEYQKQQRKWAWNHIRLKKYRSLYR